MYVKDNKIVEDFEGEIEELFKRADLDAGSYVDILYEIDSKTHKTIELWRKNYDKSNT